MKKKNNLEIEIVVPVPVSKEDRGHFEGAMLKFMFGYDRIRPELESVLKRKGVDLNALAKLCEPENLGTCPTPGALEFIPTEALAKWALDRNVDFTHGGRVAITFNYDVHAKVPSKSNTLQVNVGLPGQLAKLEGEKAKEALGDVTRILFGDCKLSRRAQDYLRAHNVDLVEISAEHAKELDNGRVPPTSRVSPAVAKLLDSYGFNTEQIGKIEVDSIRTIPEEFLDRGGVFAGDDPWTKTVWSRTTCC